MYIIYYHETLSLWRAEAIFESDLQLVMLDQLISTFEYDIVNCHACYAYERLLLVPGLVAPLLHQSHKILNSTVYRNA